MQDQVDPLLAILELSDQLREAWKDLYELKSLEVEYWKEKATFLKVLATDV